MGSTLFQKPYVACLIKVDFGGGENLGTLTLIAQKHRIEPVLGGLGLTGKLGLLTLLKLSTFIKKWLHLFKLLYL